MNLRFLDAKPKDAAAQLPASEWKKEMANVETLLATCVRIGRGTPGELMQPQTTVFKTKIKTVAPYPYVIAEDKPDQPYIELAVNPGHESVLWAMQSEANMKWVLAYHQALIKFGIEANANLLEAIKATTWQHQWPFKGLTPPPAPSQKTVRQPDVFASYRQALHYSRVTWAEDQQVPTWWSQTLHEKLCPKKQKKTDK